MRVVSLPCLPDFCALATAELGGTRGGEEGDHEEPGPHAAHGRQEEEGTPPELCWTIAEAVAWSESLARAVTCDLSWARGRARLESLELYLVVVNFKCVFFQPNVP